MHRHILVAIAALVVLGSSADAAEVTTGDGLKMVLSDTGQVTGLSADGVDLLTPETVGGFLLGEYKLNPGPELVENGGFEMTGGWHRDTSVTRSGVASLCVDVPRKGELVVRVPLKPNATYMVTFFMKSEGLDGTPIMHLRRKDAQGNYIMGQANIEYLGLYHPDWVRCQHTFQTLPGTASGELMWHVVHGKLKGKVWIDDLSIRELPLPEPVGLEGKVIPTPGGIRLQAEHEGIQLHASIQGSADRIAIEGVLRDTTGKDRCVQLTYRLPVAARGWRWYTGLDSFETIEPGRIHTTVTEIGRDTNRYVSPWPYSSIDGPQTGLSLGVPADHPCVYRMWYDEEGYYTIRMDFGLTADTRKFPGQARFALVLSRHDPRWGIRAAAKKYFTMFPQFFEVRTRPGATISNRLVTQGKDLADFGARYGDRHFGEVRWIKAANDAGMYSMTYNEPWMWRSKFGRTEQTALPSAKDVVAMERRDTDVRDTNDTGDYWEVPRAYSVRTFLNSVFHDEFGEPVMNGTRTYGGGRNRVVEWLTNADPEIVGRYGTPNRGMLSWTYEYGNDVTGARKLGGTANGIRYDSLGEWTHQGAENHRREHFAFADFPLTFSYRTGKPCQLGYFCALEYMSFVRREMLKRDGLTYANGALGVPWFAWLLDGIFRENWTRGLAGLQHGRMLMYQKNCGDWTRARMDLSDQEIERDFNECLTYAWWAGVAGRPEDFDRKRPIFKKYVPVFRSLAEAGWEPVTYASATPEGTVIERFGGEGGKPLFFTVRNMQDTPQTITVMIDTQALGLARAGVRVADVLSQQNLATEANADTDGVSVRPTIPALTTVVLSLK